MEPGGQSGLHLSIAHRTQPRVLRGAARLEWMENMKKTGQRLPDVHLAQQVCSERTRNILGLGTPEGAREQPPAFSACFCKQHVTTETPQASSQQGPSSATCQLCGLATPVPSISSSARKRHNSTCLDESCTCVGPNPD